MDTDDILASLRQEFMDDAAERVNRLQTHIDDLPTEDDLQELLTSIRREAHNLKGMGETFGFPTISLIAHRMEDFLQQVEGDEVERREEVLCFVDEITDILDKGENPDVDQEKALLRRLPIASVLPSAVPAGNEFGPEVMLVTHSSTVGQILNMSLTSEGYRVVTEKDPFVALKSAVSGHTDFVIASAVLPGISGVDLVNALSAMGATTTLPCAIVSSYDRNHAELNGLDGKIPLIRVGADMQSDISAFLKTN